MNSTFKIGLENRNEFSFEVFSDSTRKVGTSLLQQLVSFVEITCCDSIEPSLHSDETTIAKGINVFGDFDFADYIGKSILVETEILEFENNFLAFRVQVNSGSDILSSGLHVRTLVGK